MAKRHREVSERSHFGNKEYDSNFGPGTMSWPCGGDGVCPSKSLVPSRLACSRPPERVWNIRLFHLGCKSSITALFSPENPSPQKQSAVDSLLGIKRP